MRQEALLITEVDKAVLLALSRFHYLTTGQASRLLYPNLTDNNRYMQRRFKRLADAQYILRLRALPTPRYGQAPHVFTLGRRGRQYLQALGVSLLPYFRPSEEGRAAENSPFMVHRLATIDVMIAAEVLCREHPSVVCPRMLSERELKRWALKVDVPARSPGESPRRTAVIPDAWFQLEVGREPAVSIAVELDRSTEDQRAWRHKVAAYALWAEGPYEDAFETDNLTVAVVCPDMTRRRMLEKWTLAELRARELDRLAAIFVFTAVDPVRISPVQFFFSRLWHTCSDETTALLDSPQQQESGVVYRNVQQQESGVIYRNV